MSSNLGSSTNYIWSISSVLGKGATGYVYQGFSRANGEAVAVKTFNQSSRLRPDSVQIREFDVLRRVDHENIVKLLAVEEETKSHSRIIVMELCTGGSLFSILDDPENTYGLAEEEFLLVLKHTSDGMNHLRDLNIVHRDLKPGNIIKYITNDGKSVYKLTDFGAARELEEGQQFVSLYGTEEYLHPDLYERAVLRKDVRKSFGASVDLWSIGVTLFHVATGFLPFRPYGGRNNRETMFKITTQKESGIISGVQNSAKGAIEWSDQLPSTCQLSVGLRKFITPILAGLMECDPNKMWTFDHYFSEVIRLMEKRRHILFFVDQCQLLTLYVDPNDKIDKFRAIIQEQTNILPEKQRLFFEKKTFEDVIDADVMVATYPQTSLEKPLFLVGNVLPIVNYTEQVPYSFPIFASSVTVDQDAITAKSICSNGYYVKRCIEITALIFKLLQDFAHAINDIVKNQFKNLKSTVDQADVKSMSATQKMKILQSRHKTTSALLDLFENVKPSIMDERAQLSKLVNNKQESCTTVIKQLHIVQSQLLPAYQKVVAEEYLWNQWKDLPSFKNDLKKCLACANTYVRVLRSSWQHFERSRKQRGSSYVHNDPCHVLEKLRIDDNRQKLCRVYQDECLLVLQESVKDIGQWLNLVHRTSTNGTNEDLPRLVDMLDITLDKANETYDEIVQGQIVQILSKCTRRSTSSDSMSSIKSIKLAKMIEQAKSIVGAHDETADILEMNEVLISKIQAASLSLVNTLDK